MTGSKRTKFLIVQTGYEYNDSGYTRYDDFSSPLKLVSREKGQEEVDRLNFNRFKELLNDKSLAEYTYNFGLSEHLSDRYENEEILQRLFHMDSEDFEENFDRIHCNNNEFYKLVNSFTDEQLKEFYSCLQYLDFYQLLEVDDES